MDLLSTIVGKVIEITVEPIGRQLGYLIFYHRNVNRLKDEFQELQTKKEAVQHLVDAARRNGEEIEAQVRDWFREVDEITERKEKLYVEESHAKTGCSYKSCPNLWLWHQLSREAKNMKLEVAKIKEKSNFNNVAFKEPPQSIDLLSTGIEEIDSRISTMNNVLKALVDSDVKMIGLCGLGGVGKTTLATKVAKKVKEENLFDMVVMVKVAQHPDLKEIQRQIAENVGMKFEEETESLRANRLYNRLKEEKKLLVVLDDLWGRLDLGQVGIPFDFDGKKKNPFDDDNDKHYTKILMTSRNEELLSKQMNCKRIFRVGFLSESEAWELFKEKAELHGDFNDPDLLAIAVEVAQRCGGLPLAIVAVARTLRGKRLSEWNDALRRLKKPLRRNITGIKEVDSSLRLSYDYLNNQELKSIFLLSAMLSHDTLVIDLLMYSVGLSFLQDVHSMEEARDGLDALVNKLKASNLLLDSFSNDHFTMHDVIRNAALSIAWEEQHALVVRHEKQYELIEKNLPKGCTRLCLDKCDITEFPEELYCPRLEFFLLDSKDTDLRIPSMFFKSMQGLKVMNFTNLHFLSLPSSLCLLENAKTLCLHSCTLEDIAEVGKLKNLNVLSLAYSIIKRLPSELGRLTCLQMLNLAHCSKLEVIPPNLLSNLKRLEVLNMENSFKKWEAEGSSKGNANASLVELMNLPNLSSLDIHVPDASILPKDLFSKNLLKRYRIFIGQNWKWSGQYETSKTLKLKLESSIHLEHGVRKLLERVKDLYLDELYEIDNVIYGLDGRGFQHLKHLWIQNNSQIEYIINSAGPVDAFPILKTLNLHNLNGLKKLCQGQITAKSFQKLKVIKVNGCNQLEVLFSTSMVGLFGSLVEIDITNCKSIKEIMVSTNVNTFQPNLTTGVIIFHQLRSLRLFSLPTLADFFFEENATNDSDNQVFKSFFSNKVEFPKLEILKMYSVNIQYIWSNQLLHNSFSNLKTLGVEKCGILVKLIPFHILKCLTNLEELEVRSCRLLEMVFDFEELKSANKEIHSLPVVVPLKKLKLEKLPLLQHVWSNDPKGIVSFQSLRHVGVSECASLTSMFPASIAKSLIDLEELYIGSSGIEVIVVKDEVLDSVATFVFPKLTSLALMGLPNTKNFYPRTHLLECPCLLSLNIGKCDELEIFEKEISSSSRLQEEKAHHTKYLLFSQEKVEFPKLEILNMSSVNIQYIWSNQLLHNSFSNLKTFFVRECGILVKLIPLHILKCLTNLEELVVCGCSLLEMVFDFEELKSANKEIHSLPVVVPLKKLVLWDLPLLKHVWSNDPKGIVSFQSLRHVEVSDCGSLTSMFPASIAKSLLGLEELTIQSSGIEVIVAEDEVLDSVATFEFPKLTSLALMGLPNMKNFYPRTHLLECPCLRSLCIGNCDELEIFEKEISSSSRLQEEEAYHTKYPSFFQEKQIPNLKELTLGGKYATIIWNGQLPAYHFRNVRFLDLSELTDDAATFPYGLLNRFPNLEELQFRGSFQEILSCKEALGDDAGQIAPFKTLTFWSIEKLKHIWNERSQMDRFLQNLQSLRVMWCSTLINLGPSSVSLKNLTVLQVYRCDGLLNLLTSSTARSLEQLTRLEIRRCSKIEEIITKEGEDVEKEIVFRKLNYLRLYKLPRLKSFCSHNYTVKFPLLNEVDIDECPNLQGIEMIRNEKRWEINFEEKGRNNE